MIRILAIIYMINFFTIPIFTQNSFHIGLETQLYPTGLIGGIKGIYSFQKVNSVYTKFGYNLVRHRDQGVHEDERGGGFGFTFGYDRYFVEVFRGLHMGVRSDLWFNKIEWKDAIGTPEQANGKTEIIVFQPTLHSGYSWHLPSVILNPALSFGWEINIKTKGSEVGQGPILLGGFSILF